MSQPARDTPVTLEAVLQAVVTQLRLVLALPDNCAFLSLDESADPLTRPSTQFVTVSAPALTFDQGCTTGGGLDCIVVSGELLVLATTALETDEEGHDYSWLTDPILGAAKFARSVLNALHLFDPTDSTSTYSLLAEPMRATSMRPVRRQPGGLGQFAITFNIQFQLQLS